MRPGPRGRRGQSLVELALALPVLLWLACGLLDLGRAYYFAILVTDSARDGARMLSTNTGGYGPGAAAGCAAVKAATTNASSSPTCPTTTTSPGAGALLVGISCPDSDACVGSASTSEHNQPVTVDVYYGFRVITPLIAQLVPSGVITLHGRAVMNASW